MTGTITDQATQLRRHGVRPGDPARSGRSPGAPARHRAGLLDEPLRWLGHLRACAQSEQVEELPGAEIRPFGRDQMRTAAWKLPMVFIDS